MADSFERSAGGAYKQIDITEPQQVRYWTDALGVSEAELRMAVASVGVSAEEIRVNLGMAPQVMGRP